VQAQRNIQLQLETHNQYINSLLASRSSELARTISAASSARADGGGPLPPGPQIMRPASAHALRAPQPQLQQQQQQQRPVGMPASALQHPALGSSSHIWHGQGPQQGMQSPKLGDSVSNSLPTKHTQRLLGAYHCFRIWVTPALCDDLAASMDMLYRCRCAQQGCDLRAQAATQGSKRTAQGKRPAPRFQTAGRWARRFPACIRQPTVAAMAACRRSRRPSCLSAAAGWVTAAAA